MYINNKINLWTPLTQMPKFATGSFDVFGLKKTMHEATGPLCMAATNKVQIVLALKI